MTESNQDSPPRMLYKYVSWQDNYKKRLLTEGEVHFTRPSTFNDPFDCRACIDTSASAAEIRRFFEARENWPPFSANYTKKARERWITNKVVEISSAKGRSQLRQVYLDALDRGYGILSLTSRKDSLLMWAHYADSHSGLCVGLDTDTLEQSLGDIFFSEGLGSDLRKVVYTETYPVIKPLATGYSLGDFARFVSVKSPDWAYEEEWRMVLGVKPDSRRTYRLRKGAIREVILGCRMLPQHRDEVLKAIAENHSNVICSCAECHEDKYGLTFLDAKTQ